MKLNFPAHANQRKKSRVSRLPSLSLKTKLSLAQDNIDGRYASRAMGPTAPMSGPQLMSLLPLQSSLQRDFEKTAIVSDRLNSDPAIQIVSLKVTKFN